jgi:ADP-ribose pyrophosphatase
MKLPTLAPKKLVHQNARYGVYEIVADFGEFQKTYYVTERGTRIGLIIPRGEDVLLVEQYRLLVHGISLEIPGGKMDPGETPAEAAVRECFEETGIRCSGVEPLVSYLPGTDTYLNPTKIFVARSFVSRQTHSVRTQARSSDCGGCR